MGDGSAKHNSSAFQFYRRDFPYRFDTAYLFDILSGNTRSPRKAASSALYFLLVSHFECYSFVMNKHSATKKRSAKPSRRTVARKAPARKERKASARSAARKPQQTNGHNHGIAPITIPLATVASVEMASVSVSDVAVIGSALQTHKFHVGQTVFYTSSPITRPGASGSYKVVRLLPSDGDDYQYRIKHAGEAFERVAKESQLEVEG
jgi:hypothetical protein